MRRLPGTHRKLSGWIAIFAILWATLAPTISHALAGPGLPAGICSAAGSKTVSGSEGALPKPWGATSFERCAYCALQGHGFAPPVPPLRVPPPATLASGGPVLAGVMPVSRPRWSPSVPRAPPLAS